MKTKNCKDCFNGLRLLSADRDDPYDRDDYMATRPKRNEEKSKHWKEVQASELRGLKVSDFVHSGRSPLNLAYSRLNKNKKF